MISDDFGGWPYHSLLDAVRRRSPIPRLGSSHLPRSLSGVIQICLGLKFYPQSSVMPDHIYDAPLGGLFLGTVKHSFVFRHRAHSTHSDAVNPSSIWLLNVLIVNRFGD